MPFPDANFPAERRLLNEWRRALSTIASDSFDKMAVPPDRMAVYHAFVMAVRDCAFTALCKEDDDA